MHQIADLAIEAIKAKHADRLAMPPALARALGRDADPSYRCRDHRRPQPQALAWLSTRQDHRRNCRSRTDRARADAQAACGIAECRGVVPGPRTGCLGCSRTLARKDFPSRCQ